MKKDNESILYMNWLLSRGEKYDLKTIFPDTINSDIQKDIAQEMLEEAFEIAVDGTESDVMIDAMFNLEVSRRVLAEIEDRRKNLLEIYDAGISLVKDESKWSRLSVCKKEEIVGANEKASNDISDIDKKIKEFNKALNDKDTVKNFLNGKLSYSLPASDAKEIIENKKNIELDDKEIITATALLKDIEKAIKRIDKVIADCDSILSMRDKEIIQETKDISEALGENMKKEIEEKRSVVVKLEDEEVPQENVQEQKAEKEVKVKKQETQEVGAEKNEDPELQIQEDVQAELDQLSEALEDNHLPEGNSGTAITFSFPIKEGAVPVKKTSFTLCPETPAKEEQQEAEKKPVKKVARIIRKPENATAKSSPSR